MVLCPVSRRTALRAATGVLVGLAGCSTQDDSDETTPTATEQSFAHRIAAPETVTARNPKGVPAVRSAVESPTEDSHESTAAWNWEEWLVPNEQSAAALTFSLETREIDAIRAFITDTDFSTETLLIHQYNVGNCRTMALTNLRWTDTTCGDRECTRLKLQYEQSVREECAEHETNENESPPYAEGTYANEATIIRIPANVESFGQFGYLVS